MKKKKPNRIVWNHWVEKVRLRHLSIPMPGCLCWRCVNAQKLKGMGLVIKT